MAINKKIILGLLLQVSSMASVVLDTIAQQIIIHPQVGMAYYESRLLRENPKTRVLKRHTFRDANFYFACDLQYSVKKTSFCIGYRYSEINPGITYRAHFDATFPATFGNGKDIGYSSISIIVRSATASYYREIKRCRFLPQKYKIFGDDAKEITKYKLNMGIELMTSVSIGSDNKTKSVSDTTVFPPLTSIGFQATQTYVEKDYRKTVLGISLGVRLQFYNSNGDKKRFALTMVYTQGLRTQQSYYYTLSSNLPQIYKAEISSLGSYFGATISYPLLVWKKIDRQKS